MSTSPCYHEILMADSIIRRQSDMLLGTVLSPREMRKRLPRREGQQDLLVSARGDVTALFWLDAEVSLTGRENGARWRQLFDEVLRWLLLTPGAILMKQDWMMCPDASGKPYRRTLMGVTMTRKPRSRESISDFGFFSTYAWAKDPDVGFQRRTEQVVQSICNLFDGSDLCKASRIRGEALSDLMEWFLTLNGTEKDVGMFAADYLSIGDNLVAMVGVVEEPKEPLWQARPDLTEDMVVKESEVNVDKLPLLIPKPTCNMIFTQFFVSEGKTAHDPLWRALKGGSMNRPVLETVSNVITWAPNEDKLHKNLEMIEHRLQGRGIVIVEHVWTEPWFWVASIPGLAGELPTGHGYFAYPEAAARYVMPPVKIR